MTLRFIPAAALGAAFVVAPPAAQALSVYNFNDGTSQGWQISAFDTDGTTSFGPITAGFNDSINFDGGAFNTIDPTDGNGSAFGLTTNFVRPSGTFGVFEFRSPDLSSDPDWQNLESVTGFVGQPFTSSFDYSAGVLVTVEDTTGGGSVLRTFATASLPMGNLSWNERSIGALDSTFASAGIDDYVTRNVAFRIFWDNVIDSEMTFALDNVSATSVTPPPGSAPSPVPLPASLALLGLGLGALGVVARRRS